MIVKRLLFVGACMLVGGLQASGDEDASLLIVDDSSEPIEIFFQIPEDTSVDNGIQLLEPQKNAPFFSAFNIVTGEVTCAALLLTNTFGRLAISAYLGYKAYESVMKSIRKEKKRNKYVIQAAGCLGAACMLLYDGYDWVLRQGA